MPRITSYVRRRRRRALLAVLLTAGLLAGCAGLPTSGDPRDIRTVAEGSIPTAPQGPAPGQQPEQIVREFIHADAQTEYDTAGKSFVVARQFLTPAAGRDWQADSGASPVVVLSDDFSAVPDPDDPQSVTVSGRQIGALNADRSYRPVNGRDFSVTMKVTRSDGEWRISDPPENVLITRSDFSTAFRQRFVYFLDSSGRVVVPDVRYIPNTATPDLSANRLMDLLLGGPAKQLAGAARTQLGPGAELTSNVHIDSSGVAHVDLTGVDAATPSARQALAAQVVWTLAKDVQRIAITVNGLQLDAAGAGADGAAPTGGTSGPSGAAGPRGTSGSRGSGGTTGAAGDDDGTIYSLANGTVANFNPDAVPGSAQAVSDAYYIDDGAILRLSDATPMWGSVGTGSVHAVSAALSAASGALAAVARDGPDGQQLLVGRPFDHQPMATVLKAHSLTLPSFTRWGYSAWTVQNGDTQPEIYQVSITEGTPTWSRVAAPQLKDLGTVTALQLSPDGVRVALVADGALYLGVVSPAPDSSPGSAGSATADDATGGDQDDLQVTGLHVLRSDLTDVGPVTWDDSANLLVGADTAGSIHRTVYAVSVDGQSVDAVTTSQTLGDVFGDVDAIASSTSNLPMLISFGGRIWQLQGSRFYGQWVPPRGGNNWVLGTAPFYPR